MDGLLRLIDFAKPVVGLAPITPSSSTPDRVKMSGYSKLTAVIVVDNGNTVTGSDITLKQSKTAAGGSEKALGFSKMWANTDVGAGDSLTETDVTSDTFTTDETNAKNLLYVIEIEEHDLDMDNDFDWVRVGTGDGANMVLAVLYFLHGARHASPIAIPAIS